MFIPILPSVSELVSFEDKEKDREKQDGFLSPDSTEMDVKLSLRSGECIIINLGRGVGGEGRIGDLVFHKRYPHSKELPHA